MNCETKCWVLVIVVTRYIIDIRDNWEWDVGMLWGVCKQMNNILKDRNDMMYMSRQEIDYLADDIFKKMEAIERGLSVTVALGRTVYMDYTLLSDPTRMKDAMKFMYDEICNKIRQPIDNEASDIQLVDKYVTALVDTTDVHVDIRHHIYEQRAKTTIFMYTGGCFRWYLRLPTSTNVDEQYLKSTHKHRVQRTLQIIRKHITQLMCTYHAMLFMRQYCESWRQATRRWREHASIYKNCSYMIPQKQ